VGLSENLAAKEHRESIVWSDATTKFYIFTMYICRTEGVGHYSAIRIKISSITIELRCYQVREFCVVLGAAT
jgi:hypothetical protein